MFVPVRLFRSEWYGGRLVIDKTIGIVGGGTVGAATARALVEHVKDVKIYDVLPERRTESNVWDVLQCDIAFVCLPTPQKRDSLKCDTSILEKFFEEVAECRTNIVLRSTVPVGFTRRMREKYILPNLVHSPEFLTARCADLNAQCPARNVIGGFWNGEPGSNASYIVRDLYLKRWPHVPCLLVNSDESEAGKLALNSFFATKVAYFNELYLFCQRAGLNWNNVRDVVVGDGRVHPSHTLVPGPDGWYGFGGTCLPKDLASLVHQMEELGMQSILDEKQAQEHGYGSVASLVCRAAYERNKLDRKRVR
jgi:nucleotide sugar dehydrogenase